ncbi:MAG: monovalent cation/H+ antiporter complex subunit F [Rectinemataceae bacterium]|nr:monovalent cation/H+ antiporter complex subunit F [Spirochaetaceae bacterium]
MRALLLDFMAILLVLWAAGATFRLIVGPGIEDRLIALNVLAGLVLGFLVLQAARMQSSFLLDVALVYDIFGFLGFLALVRFLRRRSKSMPKPPADPRLS